MTTHSDEHYYVPHGSHWPAVGSLGLLFLMVGVSSWLNGAGAGFYIMLTGVAIIIFMVTGWFGAVIGESQGGLYNAQVDASFRQGMFWFIFSEVMFFAAFFGALFYARNMSIPWLGGESNNFFTNLLLWEGYESTWPTNGPGNVGGEYEVKLSITERQVTNVAFFNRAQPFLRTPANGVIAQVEPPAIGKPKFAQ